MSNKPNKALAKIPKGVVIKQNSDIFDLLCDGAPVDSIVNLLMEQSSGMTHEDALRQVKVVRMMAVNNFTSVSKIEMRARLASIVHKTLANAVNDGLTGPILSAVEAMAELYGIDSKMDTDASAVMTPEEELANAIELCKDMLQQRSIIDAVFYDKSVFNMVKKKIMKGYKTPPKKHSIKVIDVRKT